ncbi:MAG: hypothetical protein ACNA7J_00935 [Wenzhouxiangella sp.]
MTRASIPPPRPVALRLLALVSYPLLILVALWSQQPELRALGLPLLAVALVGPWPAATAGWAILLASLLLAAAVLALPALALWPPALVCLAVAAWFAHSLHGNSRPVIERFAAVVHEDQGREMPTESLAWMRGWTLGWAILLTVLGTVALILAITHLTTLWLIWIMGVMPLMGFATLGLEHTLRRRRFPDQEHWPLGRFLITLFRIPPNRIVR